MKDSLTYTYYPVIQMKYEENNFFLLLITGKLDITRTEELDMFLSVPARSCFWSKGHGNLLFDLTQQYIFSYI